jgi:A/G-specific adenine glycosylase
MAVDSLLGWFRDQGRDLPWRRTLDPYAIWISEIMLQQTQVKTVIPYWERWMQRFPDIAALARAETDAVLKAWEGLGYYSRARNLQAAAQILTRDFAAQFPAQHEQAISLPGIGPYTAGAICSFAFNQPTPILDGNIERVLTRIGAVPGNPRETSLKRQLWLSAARWVELAASRPPMFRPGLAGNCSAINQSLMELGATLCTPKTPHCSECPVARYCLALREGTPERYPELPKRVAATPRRFHAFVWQNQGAVWVVQRPKGVVNGGLWEFPNLEVAGEPAGLPADYARGLWAIAGQEPVLLKVIRHSITRYRIELHAHHAAVDLATRRRISEWTDSTAVPATRRPHPTMLPTPWTKAEWVKPEQASAKAYTAAHRRILEAWLEKCGSGR